MSSNRGFRKGLVARSRIGPRALTPDAPPGTRYPLVMWKRLRLAAALVSCASLFGVDLSLTGCSTETAADRPNIVLIVIDTLRVDHMSVYGYARATTPEIARYFAKAEKFENAWSAASYTSASVVSMLSGLYPGTHGIRDFYLRVSPELRLLPDFLASLGYQTAAVVSNTVLTDEALGIGSRFESYDDFVDERELHRPVYERRASRTTDAALRWLSLERDPERSHFLLLHFMDPHAPYVPPEREISTRFQHEAGDYPIEFGPRHYQRLPGVTNGFDYIDRYDEEIAYTDREMGRFLAAYQALGLLDDAIVILTSDHGETLLENKPHFEHSEMIWSEVLRVPLLIRWPQGEARINETAVSLVDLTPTILEVLAEPAPESMQGVPFAQRNQGDLLLQESWAPQRTRGRVSQVRLRSAIRDGKQWTYRLRPDGKIEKLWVADLRGSRNQGKPGFWPDRDGGLGDAVQAAVSAEREASSGRAGPAPGVQIRGPKMAPELEPHQREALRALGYAE